MPGHATSSLLGHGPPLCQVVRLPFVQDGFDTGSPGAPALSIADRFLVSGTVSGPEWTVSRGTSTDEHHDLWMTLRVVVPGGLVRGRMLGSAHGLRWAG